LLYRQSADNLINIHQNLGYPIQSQNSTGLLEVNPLISSDLLVKRPEVHPQKAQRLLTGAHPSLKAGHASRASSRFSWLHILAAGKVFFAKPPASCSKSKPTAIANPSF
jgi:hypothetical protein